MDVFLSLQYIGITIAAIPITDATNMPKQFKLVCVVILCHRVSFNSFPLEVYPPSSFKNVCPLSVILQIASFASGNR